MNTTQSNNDPALCFCVPDHCGRTVAEGCVSARSAAIRRAIARKAAADIAAARKGVKR